MHVSLQHNRPVSATCSPRNCQCSTCGMTPCGWCRERIEELASSLRFPLKKLYVVDGSTRSAHSNVRPPSAYLPAFFQ